ncbi:MAG TPA: outer membrane protein assembly factor BamE [Acetobacteraceae bacterium]|jgi:outer membrane protein assembly factor BamE (lipoprotein component of BamABCDE complex)|nr:outer membrane protein assembly factor BamE [Acetobacteraceae bacterium]
MKTLKLRFLRPDIFSVTPNRGASRASVGRFPTLIALPLLLGACSFFQAPLVQRGNRVTADQLGEITPGVQTKADVRAVLGSPTQSGMFGDDQWYYISSSTRQRPARQLAVRDRQTVVVEFDRAGVVRSIRTLGEEDGREVEMVARETPVPGNERTFLQALFGNVGRFGPGAVGQQVQQPTPGVGGMGQAASGLAR